MEGRVKQEENLVQLRMPLVRAEHGKLEDEDRLRQNTLSDRHESGLQVGVLACGVPSSLFAQPRRTVKV